MQISMKLSSGQDSGNSQEQTNPPNKMMDTMEKTLPKEKKDNFEIEVADEHGKAGQVEIDSPEEELQERMYTLLFDVQQCAFTRVLTIKCAYLCFILMVLIEIFLFNKITDHIMQIRFSFEFIL